MKLIGLASIGLFLCAVTLFVIVDGALECLERIDNAPLQPRRRHYE